MSLTIEQTLQQGVAAHKEGKLQEAERLYRAILQSQPAHPDANHNLGLIAISVNQSAAALPLFKTALEANPKIEQFWLSYIDALIKENQLETVKKVLAEGRKMGLLGEKVDALEEQLKQIAQSAPSKLSEKKKSLTLKEKRKKISESKQQKKKKGKRKNPNSASPSQSQLNNLIEQYQNGQYDEAEKLAVLITQQFPEHQLGWKVLGAVFGQTSRKSEAINANQRAVQLAPQHADAHNNLGITLKELGRLEEAEASLRQAIVLKSDFAEAHNNLGNTLQELGRLEEAEVSYTQAIALKPDYAEAHNNLGITLKELGRLEEAEASLRQAIVFKPDYAEAHSNLGATLQELGRLDEAEASCRLAIALKPDYAEAHSNLGATLKKLGRLEEAEASCRQAIALKPDLAQAHNNLGITLKELGRLDEAEVSYTQAIALKPDCATAAQNMVTLPVGQLDLKILDLCDKALFVQSESVKNQASYYFSQANLLKHKGLMEQSFDEFCKANKLRWEEVREQFATHDRRNTGNLNRIRQWTPNVPELVEGRLTKLFLMGPSRSGKSSLEHVLSKSYQVKPLYEGISFSGLSKDSVNGKDSCETLFEKIFFQSEDEFLCQGYKVVTSTRPDSIFYSDYLIDMLPNTYFLIIRRDLRDVASEIFTTEYVKGHFYSYDPNGISTYLGVYNKICEALALKVPDRCITISFEDIINSPEDTIERIGGLVCRNFEVGRLKKYVTSFTSESLFRDHFAGIKKALNFEL